MNDWFWYTSRCPFSSLKSGFVDGFFFMESNSDISTMASIASSFSDFPMNSATLMTVSRWSCEYINHERVQLYSYSLVDGGGGGQRGTPPGIWVFTLLNCSFYTFENGCAPLPHGWSCLGGRYPYPRNVYVEKKNGKEIPPPPPTPTPSKKILDPLLGCTFPVTFKSGIQLIREDCTS